MSVAANEIPQIPAFILDSSNVRSQREWKALKRKEARDVLRAVQQFQLGCAWTPAYRAIAALEPELKAIIKRLSVESWGR